MTDAACKCYHTALDIDLQKTSARSGLDPTLALVLPQWHNALLNDTNRNDCLCRSNKGSRNSKFCRFRCRDGNRVADDDGEPRGSS
jgi:hypothetical protein